MPNHFLTVGLCSFDFSRRERGEVDFSTLANANLCELAGPALPDELANIVSSRPPARYVHKKTGETFKGVNGPMENREQYNRVDLKEDEIATLKAKHGAADWFDWQTDNWGTKWGTYDTKVHEMGGDGSPILIEFQSAWGPPNPNMMRRISKYLCDNYCLSEIKWIGHDPSNSSLCDIGTA